MKSKLTFLLFIVSALARGQDSSHHLINIPQVNLFCMLNQSIYNAGDTILAAGYITNRSREIMEDQYVMYQRLIDPILRTIVAENRWAIASGLSRAKLKIPDTLDSGIYWYFAYTNYAWSHPPQEPFKQQLEIRGALGTPFNIIWDTTEEKPDSIYVHYKIGTRYKGLATGGSISYRVWQMSDSITSGTASIDDFGEAMIAIERKRIFMHYSLYEQIEIAFIVTRREERGRFIRQVKWKPKTGIPID